MNSVKGIILRSLGRRREELETWIETDLSILFSGRILSVNPQKRTVTVEHANIIKRHTRANPSKNIKGGIMEKEGPINISNVLLVCASCNKHTRIGHKTMPDGTKIRVCRRCGTTLEK